MKLNEKIVVITGAASGIGRACAIEFAKEGAKVVVAGRSSQKNKDTINNPEDGE